MLRLPEYLASRLPFFYGYIVAFLAVWALICSSPGQTFAIMAFGPLLKEELGISDTQLSLAYMLGTALAAIPLSFVGPLSDRIGLRKTTIFVAIGLSLACLFMSFARGFFTLLAGFMLLRWLGQGAMSLLPGNIVSMWFRNKLGRINGAMAVGIAAAFGLVPGLLIRSNDSFGWRNTYLFMGAFVALTLIPLVVLLLRNHPQDLGLLPDGKEDHADGADEKQGPENDGPSGHDPEISLSLSEAASGRALWILGAGMLLWALCGTGIIFFAIDVFGSFGIPKEEVQWMFTTFSSVMLASQLLGGILADRYPASILLSFGFCFLAAGACIVPLTTGPSHMHLFALAFGAGQGLLIVTSATVWVRYYGTKHLGKIRGTIWCTTVAGSGCGPALLGFLKDSYASFSPGLWLFAALLLPLGPLMLLATPPVPKGGSSEGESSDESVIA